MLWVIDGLVYGFFTAIYTLFNQHYKLNGYVLGIWRGFGISLAFMPFLYFFPVPESAYYWFLLIFQGLLIGVYDSHLFFASADFGAGPTSRFMAITALVTTFLWWFLTPEQFEHLLGNGTVTASPGHSHSVHERITPKPLPGHARFNIGRYSKPCKRDIPFPPLACSP